ncbi:hypothetical protein B4102_0741 [Heyndrickxia sporothermodurans]|uniref:Uncharacterized protein n=1 Tax=Heyndrickxia sporothermodurans TaxID=46224 RepID=A0A150KNL0_9BACI|nr:hypothetical protein B4102_0741 [Heyndrickxia sporothermodurans]
METFPPLNRIDGMETNSNEITTMFGPSVTGIIKNSLLII